VIVKPVEGVDDLGDLVARVTAKAMRLAAQTDESGLDLKELEGGVVLLSWNWCATNGSTSEQRIPR
jgi:hypothetical protein